MGFTFFEARFKETLNRISCGFRLGAKGPDDDSIGLTSSISQFSRAGVDRSASEDGAESAAGAANLDEDNLRQIFELLDVRTQSVASVVCRRCDKSETRCMSCMFSHRAGCHICYSFCVGCATVGSSILWNSSLTFTHHYFVNTMTTTWHSRGVITCSSCDSCVAAHSGR